MSFKNAKIIMFLLSILVALETKSQNSVNQTDDMGRIALTSFVPQQIDKMPDAARSMLSNKLSQISNQNGIAGSPINQRFIITANIAILTKDLTATAPPLTVLTLEITLYIGDGIEGTKFSSNSITVKGVGVNETKAYIEAIKGIKPTDPAIQSFIMTGKNKIIEYYNSECDFIIQEAQTLQSQNKFEEAISKLISVPEVCKDCFNKCMTAAGIIYKQYMDRQCRIKLDEAKTAWATSQNSDGAAAAAEILSAIDPDAACYKDAVALSAEIGKRIKELDKRDWDFKMKVHNDQVSIEKQQISTYRDVALAYAKNQPKVEYIIRGWW